MPHLEYTDMMSLALLIVVVALGIRLNVENRRLKLLCSDIKKQLCAVEIRQFADSETGAEMRETIMALAVDVNGNRSRTEVVDSPAQSLQCTSSLGSIDELSIDHGLSTDGAELLIALRGGAEDKIANSSLI